MSLRRKTKENSSILLVNIENCPTSKNSPLSGLHLTRVKLFYVFDKNGMFLFNIKKGFFLMYSKRMDDIYIICFDGFANPDLKIFVVLTVRF